MSDGLNGCVNSSLSKQDLPPPYEENVAEEFVNEPPASATSVTEATCEILDLLASCSIASSPSAEDEPPTEAPVSAEMGLKHSTPWGGRHRSKISLTWVLREQSDKSLKEKGMQDNMRLRNVLKHRWIQEPLEWRTEHLRSPEPSPWAEPPLEARQPARVVGRNSLYKDARVGRTEPGWQTRDGSASERSRRRHRRRRKKEIFGYHISNLDGFLADASIEQPGNIPVVLSRACTLYETRAGVQRERPLPLGTVLNAVFKKQAWLYVQTPHAEEGYVTYSACLPLGILPAERHNPPRRKTPCWETSSDIYPQPCGNATDAEKQHLRSRARSESGYRVARGTNRIKCGRRGEEMFDKLYLRATSVCSRSLQVAGSAGEAAVWSDRQSDNESHHHADRERTTSLAGPAARLPRGDPAVLPCHVPYYADWLSAQRGARVGTSDDVQPYGFV